MQATLAKSLSAPRPFALVTSREFKCVVLGATTLKAAATRLGLRWRRPAFPQSRTRQLARISAAMSSSAGFLIARVQLPEISLSRFEQRALKRMITRMLQHTVRELDQHTHVNGGVVNTSRWKAVGLNDDLRVYREREAGATSAALAFALDKTDALPRGSTVAPLTLPGVLMTGFTRGKVENAMDAVTTRSQEDLALLLGFMHHEDVVDCAVLKTLEPPTETDPFHFLGIKYFVRKAPVAGTKVLKHRDSVYLEFTGYTQTARDERLGFHLMHSVELSEFPPLTARKSVRTLHSLRYLYRQQSDDVVKVFMQGNLDVSGMAAMPLASAYTNDALFGLATLMACAEAKRLTQMWRAQQARNSRQDSRKQQAKRMSMALECSMCRQKRKLFGGASLAACELCADAICTRCRSDKKVFEVGANRILGTFRKVSVCKSCILASNRARSHPDEPQMRIVMSEHLQLDREGSRDRRRRAPSSSCSSGARSSRSDSSCPSASSQECSPTPVPHCRGRIESVASSGSTGSSRSYRECPVVPVSPVGLPARAHGHQEAYSINDQQMDLRQQRRVIALKTSTERASHRIQQLGSSQQLDHRIPLQPSGTRDCALRRVASTGSASSSGGDSSAYSYSTAATSQQNDLFARMAELNRVAESTYNTTQQNGVYLSQQMRSRRRT
ncbi:hypothetical protein PHYPSEUDO_002017 [Phytophthora pseudosyringae]|uniref:FYVE-type domain-containing protein n=1 Tax=Phytophthora pseudosyringae TaxID=221518 RepID=A0A8T1VUI3_9STRA|nr:hypothetical protein PHYPSEUDO_002017 [Phytophthora pseudosyringae]